MTKLKHPCAWFLSTSVVYAFILLLILSESLYLSSVYLHGQLQLLGIVMGWCIQ